MTTKEAKDRLGVSQQMVSRLCADGQLVASRDADGKLQIENASVEAYAAEREEKKIRKTAEREEKAALRAQQQHAWERERRAKREREEARKREQEDLHARGVTALERIASCLDRLNSKSFI